MIKLYMKRTCPFSAEVVEKLTELSVPFETCDIANPELEEQLMKLGGKHQTPFLLDEENNIAMYESDDINAYLEQTYRT